MVDYEETTDGSCLDIGDSTLGILWVELKQPEKEQAAAGARRV
jgi:hypothetical protein